VPAFTLGIQPLDSFSIFAMKRLNLRLYEHGVQGKFRLYGVKLNSADFGDWAQVAAALPNALGLPQERRRLVAAWPTGLYQGCQANPAGQQLACFLSSGQVQVVPMAEGSISNFLPGKVNGLPKWSPKGEMVAFSNSEGFWTVATDGWSNPVKVSESVKDFTWSPDGKWLAIVPKGGKSGIFRVRPNGKDQILVVPPGNLVRSISWQRLQQKK
jgi:WD40-like Beta Propeller Repeat